MSTATETAGTMTAQRVTLALVGLSQDGGGSLALERALVQHAGVHYAYVCTATEMAYVVYDALKMRPDQLVAAVEQAGFSADTPVLR